LREDLRLVNAARRRFGSYTKELRTAGFSPEKVRIRRPGITPADIAKLGREMRRVATLHGHPRAKAAQALKKNYKDVVFNHLGNWRKACRKFGVKMEDISIFPYHCRRHVAEGLRRWEAVTGAHAYQIYKEDRSLVRASLNFFRSWSAALKAAGVSFTDGRRSPAFPT
jgi:hypothetical protein